MRANADLRIDSTRISPMCTYVLCRANHSHSHDSLQRAFHRNFHRSWRWLDIILWRLRITDHICLDMWEYIRKRVAPSSGSGTHFEIEVDMTRKCVRSMFGFNDRSLLCSLIDVLLLAWVLSWSTVNKSHPGSLSCR